MFTIFLKKKADKFLSSLDRKRKEKVYVVLETLEKNPVPFRQFDLKKLKGEKDAFRIRIGKIRIVYHVFFEESKIVVDLIDFRGRAY